ncbi:MAG: GumC family protein [Pyrinomonadaceae bacterium]
MPRTSAEIQPAQPASPSEYPPGYAAFYDEDFEGKRSIRQYINVVYKRLPIILTLALVVTAAVALWMYRQPSVYLATAEMVIEPPKPKVTDKDSININFGYDANYTNTQLQLLQSPDLMKRVVIKLGIYRDPDALGAQGRGLLSGVKSVLSGEKQAQPDDKTLAVVTDVPDQSGADAAPAVVLTPEEDARAAAFAGTLSSGLTVSPVERTNIVNISVKSENPALAARVADMLAITFKEEDARRQTAGARQAYEDLRKSIDSLTKDIRNDEAKLTQAMRDANLPLQEKGMELNASRLQSLSETWLKAMEGRRQIEARYNAAVQASARGEGMNIPDLYENKVFQDTMRLNTERKAKLQDQIRDIEKQIKEAEAEKAELLVKYTPEYFKVRQVEERINSLNATKQQTEKEVSSIIERDQKKIEQDAVKGALTALGSQLSAARTQEAQALAAYQAEAARANIEGQVMTDLTNIKRSIETKRTLLDTYIQRQKEQELALTSDVPNNIVVSNRAVVPTQPIGPKRERNIVIALFLSLAAGIGLAFLLDYLDDSVKTSDDIGRHLGLPTLALIPHYLTGEKRRQAALVPAAADGNGNPGAALITLQERHSPMAEAYRHLRTSLLFSSAGKPPQTILVTSSQPSEGKTTTAINTAVTLAQAEADVVVIDCDLRRPRIHNYFGMDNSQGLTNYLSGERNIDNLIKSYPGLPRLKVITSGPIPPNPAELLSSQEMRNLLQFLRGRFKHVIIDSPPAISFTDAAILATITDGVVLVAMANKSSLHLMRRFKQRLATLGARIYGVVLNGIKSGSMEYEYYGSSYYDYYARTDADSTPVVEEPETAKAVER